MVRGHDTIPLRRRLRFPRNRHRRTGGQIGTLHGKGIHKRLRAAQGRSRAPQRPAHRRFHLHRLHGGRAETPQRQGRCVPHPRQRPSLRPRPPEPRQMARRPEMGRDPFQLGPVGHLLPPPGLEAARPPRQDQRQAQRDPGPIPRKPREDRRPAQANRRGTDLVRHHPGAYRRTRPPPRRRDRLQPDRGGDHGETRRDDQRPARPCTGEASRHRGEKGRRPFQRRGQRPPRGKGSGKRFRPAQAG